MAAGKQVGEFSLKTTSLTLTPGPGGSVLVQEISKDPPQPLELSSARQRS